MSGPIPIAFGIPNIGNRTCICLENCLQIKHEKTVRATIQIVSWLVGYVGLVGLVGRAGGTDGVGGCVGFGSGGMGG